MLGTVRLGCRVLVLTIGAAWCGCDDDTSVQPPDAVVAMDMQAADDQQAPATNPHALFSPGAPHAGAAWGVLPFPSDLYLDGNGHLKMLSLPTGMNPNTQEVSMLTDTLSLLKGAGVYTNVYFPIDGDLDPATLSGNVKVVDLDGSPGRPAAPSDGGVSDGGTPPTAPLTELAVDLEWRKDLQAIVAAPKIGIVLQSAHRYAAYLTSGIKGVDGAPLVASAAFAAAAGRAPTSDPGVMAAHDNVAPLLSALPPATVAQVMSATVFTTEPIGHDVKAMRDYVATHPPAIAVTRVRGPSELDSACGVQSPTAAPGLSDQMYRAQPHSHIQAIVHGTIDLPNFGRDSANHDAFFVYDSAGNPTVQTLEHAKFTVVLPVASSYKNLPVVLYVHGIKHTRQDMLTIADDAAARGWATVGVDIAYHGDRALMPVDNQNDITGDPNPDGFGDANGLTAPIEFFHLAANGPIPAYHPTIMRNNLMQGAVDICSMTSLVVAGDLTPINTALATAGLPSNLSFDPRGPAIDSVSFGSLLSGVALAVEPRLKIAALHVMPAGFAFPALLWSAKFSPLFSNLVTGTMDVASRVHLGDSVTDARFEPAVMLWNWALEQGDSFSYAPMLLSGTMRGGVGPSVLLTEPWADETVHNLSEQMYAAALGVPTLITTGSAPPSSPPLHYATLAPIAGPVAGNIGPLQTAVHIRFYPATHSLDFRYEEADVYAPGVPFASPPATTIWQQMTPNEIQNPIVQVHKAWVGFFSSYFAGAAPTVSDPYAP